LYYLQGVEHSKEPSKDGSFGVHCKQSKDPSQSQQRKQYKGTLNSSPARGNEEREGGGGMRGRRRREGGE
jgi:hypothetical protein